MNLETIYYNPSLHFCCIFFRSTKITRSIKRFPRTKQSHGWKAKTHTRYINLHVVDTPDNLYNIDDLWEADIVDLRAIKNYNDNYAYLLIVIDVRVNLRGLKNYLIKQALMLQKV